MITLTPAYGRDYKSKAAAQSDLDAGKDFILNDYASRWNGKPVNKDQLVNHLALREVVVRYGGLRKTAILKVSP